MMMSEEVKKAYENLANEIGIKIDPNDTEKFLRNFLCECAKVVLQERDWNLTGLKGRLTVLEKSYDNIVQIDKKLQRMAKEVVCSAEDELTKIDREIRAKRAELRNAKNNPFMLEVLELVDGLKAKGIPDKEISDIVATYITSLGYIRYKGTPSGDNDRQLPRAR